MSELKLECGCVVLCVHCHGRGWVYAGKRVKQPCPNPNCPVPALAARVGTEDQVRAAGLDGDWV